LVTSLAAPPATPVPTNKQADTKGARPQIVLAMDPDYPPPQYLPGPPDSSQTSDQKRKRKRARAKISLPFLLKAS